MTSAIRIIAVAVLVALAAPRLGGQATRAGRLSAPTYNIIDLGTFGGATSVALGVNEKGQVVGSADTPQGRRHAYLWENGVMTDLGTLGFPTAESEASDVNNQGVVVGTVGSGDPNRSFIWENGVQAEIGPSQIAKSAYGINDAKQVVGIHVYPGGGGNKHAFLWENGILTDLGTLGGTRSIAWDINLASQVVGSSYTTGFSEHAFLWQAGTMSDLGTLGGSNSEGFDLNDLGAVVGWAQRDPGDTPYQAFLWMNGQMTDLGALGGFDSSSAEAINNHGVVVGTGGTAQQGHAFLYDPQQGMRYLEDMIPPDAGWTGFDARDINDAGWIVGSATSPTGFRRAFLMIPVNPIPAVDNYGAVTMTMLILTSGAILVLRAIRRRHQAPTPHAR